MMTPPMPDVGHIAFSASLVFLAAGYEGLFTVSPTGKAVSAVYAPSDRDGSAIQPSSGSTSCGAPNARSRLRQAHAA
jgi:hypothetical protein